MRSTNITEMQAFFSHTGMVAINKKSEENRVLRAGGERFLRVDECRAADMRQVKNEVQIELSCYHISQILGFPCAHGRKITKAVY